jgi:hypothetical protein
MPVPLAGKHERVESELIQAMFQPQIGADVAAG